MRDYIRYAAEQVVGWTNANGDLRKFLLTETLWALVLTRRVTELATGINRDRLPGRNGSLGTLADTAYEVYQQGLSMQNLMNSAIELFARFMRDKPNPLNRPEVNVYGKIKETVAFQLGNSRTGAGERVGNAGVVNNLWDNLIEAASNVWENITDTITGAVSYDRPYNFNENYLKGGGIRRTLYDLCEGKKAASSILSVENLLEILKNSPYITTPSQFGTIHEGRYGTQTLDTNAYWEVVIEPLVDDYLNGGWSYLPCFEEINAINISLHGIKTAYNKWVPINSFELQKAKLTTKSVGLFDGEFSFPISAELTNEIRFTIVDDQYKSWRNYFQKCMDVAVYSSEPHNYRFYQFNRDLIGPPLPETSSRLSDFITVVDKSMICVAFYKNITFRIKIYVMTPQYSTIRRFDLLCVLKDFSEEYSGDVDTGGTDLNVTFSIVGENPDDANEERIGQEYINDLDYYYLEEEVDEFLATAPRPDSGGTNIIS